MVYTDNSLQLFLLQEADEEYKRSIKKGMLDYVLLEENEQKRLGVPMSPKVF